MAPAIAGDKEVIKEIIELLRHFRIEGTCGGGKQVSKVAKIIQEIHHRDQTPKGTHSRSKEIQTKHNTPL